MNIKDIKREDINIEGDMLEAMFKRQNELEKKYRPIEISNGVYIPRIPLDMNTFEGQERVRSLIYRITEELFEAGNCLRNKAWKQSQVPLDIDHFVEELADAWHFFIQLWIELGYTAIMVTIIYFKKSLVNIFRQKSKY